MYDESVNLGVWPFDPGDPFGPKFITSESDRRVVSFHLGVLQRNARAYQWYATRIPSVHFRLVELMREWHDIQEAVDRDLVRPAYERAVKAGAVVGALGLGPVTWIIIAIVFSALIAFITSVSVPNWIIASGQVDNARRATEAEIERAQAVGEIPQFPPGVLPEPDVPGTGVDAAVASVGGGIGKGAVWLLGLIGVGFAVKAIANARK